MSYTNQLVKDLKWLYEHWSLGDQCPVPEPELADGLLEWHQYICAHPEQVYKRIECAESAEVEPLHIKKKQVVEDYIVQSPQCSVSILNSKLNGHLAKAHGHRNPCKPYVAGCICHFCLRDFQTRPKLVNHLMYQAPKCWDLYLKHVPKLSPAVFAKEELATAKVAKQIRALGRRPLWSALPITRISGPLLPIWYSKEESQKR